MLNEKKGGWPYKKKNRLCLATKFCLIRRFIIIYAKGWKQLDVFSEIASLNYLSQL